MTDFRKLGDLLEWRRPDLDGQHVTVGAAPLAAGELEFSESKPSLRDRVGAEEENEQRRLIDRFFDPHVVLAARGKVIPVEENLVAASPQRECDRLRQVPVLSRIGKENLQRPPPPDGQREYFPFSASSATFIGPEAADRAGAPMWDVRGGGAAHA